ncbi:serine hydrolase domain-containing protein [Streptacidiphilus fuscans]|uniref:Beta-lactamase family protein n=1 Tax=Streptacidiphilus fuscans TaxID=2789292 RepID=A0A931FG21_9ACTN|nr:serine hydrolase domain-containing protein [Streptacidiphilus fuscans]MBF9069019.1 beta-lactamase family protein [Streptacidiphilus fuscans]
MSESSRSLPDRPSLRFLRLEARRRLAAGEFTALWEAYLAIAREHGFSSWTALKQQVVGDSRPDPDEAVLDHLSWVVSRLAGASQPDWEPPAEQELAEHFEQSFLDRPAAGQLIEGLSTMARTGRLRDEVTVITQRARFIRAQAGDLRIETAGTNEPPHRLRGILAHRVGKSVTDTRVAAPPADVAGNVPQAVVSVAEQALGEVGLPGLVLAGVDDHGKPWAMARGWARLDPKEPLSTTHRFPVYAVSTLITATAVLRLAADGRLDLDRPANDHLRAIRLANGDITVRDLLTRTDGLAPLPEALAETVPGLAELTGPVLASSGVRGSVAGFISGYAALGALIADITGSPYPQAAARLVLDPLGMTGSSFLERWPAADERAVGCHMLDTSGAFVPAPAKVATVPAALGLWTTAADLVRFGLGWSSLLPAPLAEEATRPLARPSAGWQVGIGLGWLINESRGVAAASGGVPHGAAASLIVKLDNGKVHIALTNRGIPIDEVNGRVLDALTGS